MASKNFVFISDCKVGDEYKPVSISIRAILDTSVPADLKFAYILPLFSPKFLIFSENTRFGAKSLLVIVQETHQKLTSHSLNIFSGKFSMDDLNKCEQMHY